VRLLAKGQLLQ